MTRENVPSPLTLGAQHIAHGRFDVVLKQLGLPGQRLSPDEIVGVDPFSEPQ